MARNIEVLRNYFLGKDPQLKETMADNSLRLIGIEGKHFVLRTELIARLEKLKNYVDEKDTELREAIDEVIQDLENETAERVNADRILQQNIDNEKTARQTADTTLQNNINAERTQRQNADTTLQQNIDGETLTRENVDALLQNMINHEIDDRASADTTLQNNINAEETARENADTALDSRIDDVEADLGNYYTKTETDDKYVARSGDTMTGSLAMGSSSEASGEVSFAQGNNTVASGNYSHAEGSNTMAFGSYSHVEGEGTATYGVASHAEGNYTATEGDHSHAEGSWTMARGTAQHVQGRYNIGDTSLANIIGNGTANSSRSNAHTVDWNGNAWYAGDVYTGSTSGTNKDAGSKKLATEEYVDTGLASKQDTLIPGDGISIINNLIKVLGDTIIDVDTLEAGNYSIWRIYNQTPGIYRVHNGENYTSCDLYYNSNPIGYFTVQSGSYVLLSQGENGDLLFTVIEVDLSGSYPITNIYTGFTNKTQSTGNYRKLQLEKFKGTDGTTYGTKGLVPAPLATDVGKFLSADGTWAEVDSSVPQGSIIQYDGNTIPTGYEEVSGGDIYSTTEQVVGTWIDGKPLYRKVISGTIPTVSTDGTEAITTITINTGETTSSDFYAIKGSWVRYYDYPHSMWTMPYYNNSMRFVKNLLNFASGNNFNLQVSSNGTAFNNCTFYCLVEYTKTTDSVS